MNEVILPNTLTLNEHVKRILQAKTEVQKSIIDMAIVINEAVTQLDDTSQNQLAEKIGMSKGTLSKWVSIGSNQNLLNYRNKLPGSFSTLYELTNLDRQYQSHYGEDEGSQKFVTLIEDKITPDTEKTFVDQTMREHREIVRDAKTTDTQNKIENAFGKSTELQGNVFNLEKLISAKKYFSTFVIIPTPEQLSRWRNLELDDYIYEEYPLADIRKTSHSGTLHCVFQSTMNDIETALKCLYAFGFNYRDTLIPEQNISGFSSLNDSTVFVRGVRGISKSNKLPIKSSNLQHLLEYAEQLGTAPYLLVGEKTKRKDWLCCIE